MVKWNKPKEGLKFTYLVNMDVVLAKDLIESDKYRFAPNLGSVDEYFDMLEFDEE